MPLEVSESATLIAAPVIAFIGAAALLFVVISPIDVKICLSDGTCRTFTKTEYQTTKENLATKYENNTQVSWEEYRTFVAILDKEIKRRGAPTFVDVTSTNVFRQKVATFLRTNE